MKKIELDLKVAAAIDEIAEEIKKLPRVKGGKIGRVPAHLQESIVEVFHESGLTAEDLASRLGITGTTIRAWDKRKKARRAKKTTFTQVKVREAQAPVPARGLTLEIPGGARVHGLGMKEIRELLGGSQ